MGGILSGSISGKERDIQEFSEQPENIVEIIYNGRKR